MNRFCRSLLTLHALCALIVACQPAPGPIPVSTSFSPSPIPTAASAIQLETNADLNPLTGQRAVDASLLEIPALLVSISHFPATARPQAGLSFAPIVYEVSITEGASRFLAVFYGEWPAVEVPTLGGCAVRSGVFDAADTLLGNRVWLDADADGAQDLDEPGTGGVCVRLYDPSGNLVMQTTTDSNGYYGFGVAAGAYVVQVERPAWAVFSPADAVDDGRDSDADPASGQVPVELRSDDLSIDVGLIGSPAAGAELATVPAARIGPIRSGRLVYAHIAAGYRQSCLIFAGASPQVMDRLPVCYQVFHQLDGGGYMLDISEMQELARENARLKGSEFNYRANVFDDAAPSGGLPARRLHVYFAYLNQSAWEYDPLYQAYLRYVDTSDYEEAGKLHPEVDRLTGRQLHFENVIVLFARHDVVSPSNLDIRLDPGRSGPAVLFRDGNAYEVKWNTFGADEEDPRPLQITGAGNRPLPLKPGHTWILVTTPDSALDHNERGEYRLSFSPPEGAD